MKTEKGLISISDLSYTPLGVQDKVLTGINLEINKGDFVLLLGPSGCGKTTLIRCFDGLIPHLDSGKMEGSVVVNGKDTFSHEIHEFSQDIGMVFQNPDDQILSLKVIDEVAWGTENLGLSQKDIATHVDRAMKILDIESLSERLTFTLSGGQKQKVSIASNLAMTQDILVLDDPTTDLDPVCTGEVISTLAEIHKNLGKTIIVIEHDLNDLIELATRIVFMNEGTILYVGSPVDVLSNHYDELMDLGMNMPQHIEIGHSILGNKKNTKLPVHKEEVFNLLEKFVDGKNLSVEYKPEVPTLGKTVLTVEKLDFSYHKKGWFLEAALLYCEREDSRARRLAAMAQRKAQPHPAAGVKGRPTKKDRRQIRRFTET